MGLLMEAEVPENSSHEVSIYVSQLCWFWYCVFHLCITYKWRSQYSMKPETSMADDTDVASCSLIWILEVAWLRNQATILSVNELWITECFRCIHSIYILRTINDFVDARTTAHELVSICNTDVSWKFHHYYAVPF